MAIRVNAGCGPNHTFSQYETEISLVAKVSARRCMRGKSLDSVGKDIDDYRSELRIVAWKAEVQCPTSDPEQRRLWVHRAMWNRAKDLSRKNAREYAFRAKYKSSLPKAEVLDGCEQLDSRNMLNQLASRIRPGDAACFLALLFSGGVREAAKDLGMVHSTFYRELSIARKNAQKLLEAA